MNIDLERLKTAAHAACRGVWSIGQSHVETNDSIIECWRDNETGPHDENLRHIGLCSPDVVLELIARLEAAEQRAGEMEARYDRLTLDLAAKQERLERAEAGAFGGYAIRHADGKRWRTLDSIGVPDWTENEAEALRFSLRAHADAFAGDDPDDVRIACVAPYADQVAAALYQPEEKPVAAVPPGYALVPIEPTDAMLDAPAELFCIANQYGYRPNRKRLYAAMIAAAPQAPAVSEDAPRCDCAQGECKVPPVFHNGDTKRDSELRKLANGGCRRLNASNSTARAEGGNVVAILEDALRATMKCLGYAVSYIYRKMPVDEDFGDRVGEARAKFYAALDAARDAQADRATIEAEQRARMQSRFANRPNTGATADFDLPAPNDPIGDAQAGKEGV